MSNWYAETSGVNAVCCQLGVVSVAAPRQPPLGPVTIPDREGVSSMKPKACWAALALAFLAAQAEAQVNRGAICMTQVT
jgi:hypothetical protein